MHRLRATVQCSFPSKRFFVFIFFKLLATKELLQCEMKEPPGCNRGNRKRVPLVTERDGSLLYSGASVVSETEFLLWYVH